MPDSMVSFDLKSLWALVSDMGESVAVFHDYRKSLGYVIDPRVCSYKKLPKDCLYLTDFPGTRLLIAVSQDCLRKGAASSNPPRVCVLAGR
jgi:hypothetical protein